MPSTSTLKRYITRSRMQLDKQKKKALYSRNDKDKFEAIDRVKELEEKISHYEHEILLISQQIQLNKICGMKRKEG